LAAAKATGARVAATESAVGVSAGATAKTGMIECGERDVTVKDPRPVGASERVPTAPDPADWVATPARSEE
jgi:hypothetical protein